jgi:hypothetical protein
MREDAAERIISNTLGKYGLRKDCLSKNLSKNSKEYYCRQEIFFRLYTELRLSTKAIAYIANVSKPTVINNLKVYSLRKGTYVRDLKVLRFIPYVKQYIRNNLSKVEENSLSISIFLSSLWAQAFQKGFRSGVKKTLKKR